MAWTFEPIAGPYEGGAAGVVWDGERVLFCAPEAGLILAHDLNRGVEELRRHAGGIRGLAIGPNGSLYGCQGQSRRMVRLDPDGSTVALPHKLAGAHHNNPLDADVDARERIWFSDPLSNLRIPGPMVFPLLHHASVLRLDRVSGRGWTLHRMTFDTAGPGAILLSGDDATLFVAEAGEHVRELRAYPIEEKGLGPYTVLHTFGADHRGPHPGVAGMCLDAEGNVVACAGGAGSGPGPMIYVFTPEGRMLSAEPAPADPVDCAFAGEDLSTLVVTTTAGELQRCDDSGLRGHARFAAAAGGD